MAVGLICWLSNATPYGRLTLRRLRRWSLSVDRREHLSTSTHSQNPPRQPGSVQPDIVFIVFVPIICPRTPDKVVLGHPLNFQATSKPSFWNPFQAWPLGVANNKRLQRDAVGFLPGLIHSREKTKRGDAKKKEVNRHASNCTAQSLLLTGSIKLRCFFIGTVCTGKITAICGFLLSVTEKIHKRLSLETRKYAEYCFDKKVWLYGSEGVQSIFHRSAHSVCQFFSTLCSSFARGPSQTIAPIFRHTYINNAIPYSSVRIGNPTEPNLSTWKFPEGWLRSHWRSQTRFSSIPKKKDFYRRQPRISLSACYLNGQKFKATVEVAHHCKSVKYKCTYSASLESCCFFFPFAIGFTLYISKEEDVRTPSPGMVWFLEAVSKSAVPLNRGPFPYRPHGNGIKECWTGKALFPLWLVLHSSGEKTQAPNNNIAVRLAFTGAPLSASHSIVLLKVTQEGGC